MKKLASKLPAKNPITLKYSEGRFYIEGFSIPAGIAAGRPIPARKQPQLLKNPVIEHVSSEPLNPSKSYFVWFMPDSQEKEPPRYRVLVSAAAKGWHTATIIAMNSDTPVSEEGVMLRYWHRSLQRTLDELCLIVNKELIKLNQGKDIQYSTSR